jgi:hypothetical protein
MTGFAMKESVRAVKANVPGWLSFDQLRQIAAERGIRLAQTPRSARVRCLGCRDSENLRRPPESVPLRCETCPVTRRQRHIKLKEV